MEKNYKNYNAQAVLDKVNERIEENFYEIVVEE